MTETSKLAKIDRAIEDLEPLEKECTLCPRNCRVDRTKSPAGVCRSGAHASLSHGLLHHGEEPVLSGGSAARRGSGTIFFTGCNLKCLFCQNYQLSWLGQGRTVSDAELASLMLDLQDQGANNINLVSPTHFVVAILRALRTAIVRGLEIPLVYNSNGYDKVETLEKLAGIIDFYLPDLKYLSARLSKRYSGADDYFARAGAAVQEMFFQQPDLVLNEHDVAVKGMIVRHLVLPGHADDSLALLDWVSRTFPKTICLSLMSQFKPCYRAPEEIRRPLTPREYKTVVSRAQELGFENLFLQSDIFEPDEHLVPDFSRPEPFRWKK